ncbi:MAG: 4-(cytidine 5'-diphospho)-2-C-methyl-D-erythritol kinase [Alphaproteobacteria bacterium]
MTASKTYAALAPAKINLSLHVKGRLENDYHALESLVAFADIGDHIEVSENSGLDLDFKGPHENSFPGSDKNEGNLVIRAARALAQNAGIEPRAHIILTKNLPLASGIGGGSSDAAATIKLLLKLWNISPTENFIMPLLEKLGADVPICYYGRPARITGAGEKFEPVTLPENTPLLLVNPGKPCPTPNVFRNFSALGTQAGENQNDLLEAALKIVPEIKDVLKALKTQNGLTSAGMSGSGATCFGLFEKQNDAEMAAAVLQKQYPSWWVKDGLLNPSA